MLKFVVVHKSDPALLPPLVTTCRWLRRIGCSVTLLCVDPDRRVREMLEAEGVRVEVMPGKVGVNEAALIRYARFARYSMTAWRFIDRHLTSDTILWVGSVETAAALGRRLHQQRYVIHAHELYDREYRYRRLLPAILGHAESVVVPEANRAALLRYWYGLQRMPFVIPNKPIPLEQCGEFVLELPEQGRTVFESKQKVVLYQGLIDLKERNLLPLARAVEKLGTSWSLVLMGHDMGSVGEIRKVHRAVVHLPFVAPPRHLEITRMARVGAVSYSWQSLNTLFCAPNKIWEYAACGKPMVCNDLPGLVGTVGRFGAGLCVSFEEPGRIAEALVELDGRHDEFVKGCLALDRSADLEALFRIVCEALKRGSPR